MIRCYKFGLLDPTSGFDQSAIDQLFLRNKLWNNLVALEHEFKEKYRILRDESNAELKSLNENVELVKSQIDDLVKTKMKLRQKERTKNINSKLIDANIKDLKLKKAGLYAKIKVLRAYVKTEIEPETEVLNKAQYEAVKALTKESGLWWGNHETLVDSYNVARFKAAKEGAKLNFKHFDGSGKFAVRFKHDGYTFDELIDGKSNDFIIEKLDTSHLQNLSRRGILSRARHQIKISIYTFKDENGKLQRHYITLPLIMHREMNDQGKIKFVHVQRKRLGNQFYWTCSFTMKTDEVEANVSNHPSKLSVGIDVGYRLVKDGLRVASCVDSNGSSYHLVLPKDWMEKMDYKQSLNSELSHEMNLLWAKLKNSLSYHHSYPEHLKEIIHSILIKGDKVPIGGIKKLYKALKSDENLMPECLTLLNEWDKKTYKRQREMENLYDKLLSRRKHIYRNFSNMISKKYAHVIIEKINLSDLAKKEKSETESNNMPDAVKENRVRASLYSLIESIRLSCIKSGSYFEKAEAAYSSVTCNECGHVNPSTEMIHFTCEACGTLHDVDENAAKNFLKGEKSYARKIA